MCCQRETTKAHPTPERRGLSLNARLQRSQSAIEGQEEIKQYNASELIRHISDIESIAARVNLKLLKETETELSNDTNLSQSFGNTEMEGQKKRSSSLHCRLTEIKSMLQNTENVLDKYSEKKKTFFLKLKEYVKFPKYTSKFEKKESKGALSLLNVLFTLQCIPKHSFTILPVSLNSYFESLSSGNSISEAESMSNELLRLSSFNSFPRYVNVFVSLISRAGFYYTGQSDEVKCFSCGITHRNWTKGDNPMEIHRRLSPLCSYVVNFYSDNDLVSAPSTSTETNTQLSHGSDINQTESSTTMTNGATVQPTPHNQFNGAIINTTQNENGHDSYLTRISTSNTNSHSQQNNTSHENNATGSSGSTNVNKATDFSSLGIDLEKPRYPNYAPIQVRISSFQGWPSYLDQTPQQMAKAGFLYAGYQDYTRCFFCGGGLRNWEAGDDPWVEHARWFPKCTYLKQNKGEKFIKAVQDRKDQLEKEQNQNTSENVPSQARTAALNLNHSTPNRATNEQQSSPLNTVAARSVLEMGYTDDQVLHAIQQILSTTSVNTEITATDIMSVLLNDDIGPTSSASSVSTRQEVAANDNTANGDTVNGVSENNTLSLDETELLEEENRQLKDQRLCKICLEFETSIAFLPCGHLVCCSDCAPAMRKCPICRAYVKGTVKTFLA